MEAGGRLLLAQADERSEEAWDRNEKTVEPCPQMPTAPFECINPHDGIWVQGD